jgi:transposase-like protein
MDRLCPLLKKESATGFNPRRRTNLSKRKSTAISPRHLWRKLRTTNVIERCFVEVRRRTRPMVCCANVESVDRIIYSIFQRFNL